MKSNENQQANSLFEALKNDKHQLLVHLLSPIERAAIEQKYYVFEYSLNNIKIQVSSQTCQQLKQISLIKISLFTKILDENSLFLIGEDAKIQMFLDTPIEHHYFPTRLYHTLKGMDCHTMLDVIKLGRGRVSHGRGMGEIGLQLIDELLEKYGCGFLFSK
ncbi:MAG: hypothetical protein JWP12_1409 [Bacteroidetes bacterium]|nr:hypothetical protein [Bacteroidota bacterium]